MKGLIAKILIFAAMAAAMTACGSDSPDDRPKVSRTVLVYMAANNNLASETVYDIHEMEVAADNGALDTGGRLLVLRSTSAGTELMEIVKGAEPVTLLAYDDIAAGESVDPETMRRVFDDMRSLAPAESYGLVLWSHGTGWMDESGPRLSAPQLRSFGYDAGRRMSLPELREALEGQGFDWIYFDCCHMGTVEVVYELRDCARIIVASPTELPVEGMRYDKNVPLFFKPVPDLVGAARNTYENYADNSFCTMSVVETAKLGMLATASRRVFEEAAGLPDDFSGIPFMRRQVSPICTIYDMADYIRALGASSTALDSWTKAYNDAILYSAATRKCFDLDLTGYSGLGCNVLFRAEDSKLYNYDRTAWWADVVSRGRN